MKVAYLFVAVAAICLSLGSLFVPWTRETSFILVTSSPDNTRLRIEHTLDYYLDGYCYECSAPWSTHCLLPVNTVGKHCVETDAVTAVYLYLVLELLLLVIAVTLNLNGDRIAGKNQTARKYLFALPTTLAVLLSAFAMITWSFYQRDILATSLTAPARTETFVTGYILQISSACCCVISILLFLLFGVTRPATKAQVNRSPPEQLNVNGPPAVNGHANPTMQVRLLPEGAHDQA